MTHYVALVSDLTGRYANVLVQANTWDQAIDQLEDAGCEVIEDQSEDYEEYGIGLFPANVRWGLDLYMGKRFPWTVSTRGKTGVAAC